MFKTDFIGKLPVKNLYWAAGYHFSWIETSNINRNSINKGKEESEKFPDDKLTLFEEYKLNGIIPKDEADGGITSSIRLGIKYDSRNKEAAPSKGIWTEAHVILAPKFLGTQDPHYRYSISFRHYIPFVKKDVLTLAYRLNYQGTFGDKAPFYVLPFMTTVGNELDTDGFGGSKTVRGMLRDRVQGLDVVTYNVELRWRSLKFNILRQNIALGFNAFSDGTMSVRSSDLPHISFGCGLRFIMNENFIVCAEYGKPINKQDGNGSLYINLGYLF